MSFSSEKARNYLLEHGEVYTFRTKRRKKIGDDWINVGRGKPKIADVFIDEVGLCNPYPFPVTYEKLSIYVAKSGFDNVNEWLLEMLELNGKIEIGWIYKVMLRNE